MAWSIITTLDSPTSGTFIFTGLSLSTYKLICVEISAVTVTTDGTDLRMTLYTASTEVVSGYEWAGKSGSSGGSSNSDSAASQTTILLCSNDANWDTGNASTKSFGATVTIEAPGSTALYKKALVQAGHTGPTGNVVCSMFCGIMPNAGAIDGIKVSGTSNLTAGKVRILGLT